jgi:hypothetical protein
VWAEGVPSSTKTFEPGSAEGAARGEEGVQDFEGEKVGFFLLRRMFGYFLTPYCFF